MMTPETDGRNGHLRATAGTEEQSRSLIDAAQLSPRGIRIGDYPWPPVADFAGFDDALGEFLAASADKRRARLEDLRAGEAERYGAFLHGSLAQLHPYHVGQRGAPYAFEADDAQEMALLTAKIMMERELIDHWCAPTGPLPPLTDQVDVADHLDDLARTNPAVRHPLFDFYRDEAALPHLRECLAREVVGNELADDHAALQAVGLHGAQRLVTVAALWDRHGRGRWEHSYAHRLYRLQESLGGRPAIEAARAGLGWYGRILTNVWVALLTRPAYRRMAYGYARIVQGWTEPHLRRLLIGLDRNVAGAGDLRSYLEANVQTAPRLARELSDALRLQRPRPSSAALTQIMAGAQLAVDAGMRQFDRLLAEVRAAPSDDGNPTTGGEE